ncbi:MAG: hypothetical protein JWO71_2824 [Candidatus Acidoferrum typicum]|nr:hypothetical protein [Candidatus Acidoferrum typicum]
MKRRVLSTFLMFLTAPMVVQGASTSSEDIAAAAKAIQLEDVRAKMFFLGGEEMAGRLIGTPEHRVAAAYIQSEFMSLGLKPGGDDNTYLQGFDVVSAWPDESKGTVLEAAVNGQRRAFQLGHDFNPWWVQAVKSEAFEGPVVFVGYGIKAPEYGYDDFAGVNLHGKIALVLPREPQADHENSKFRGRWDTYHSYDWFKIQQLQEAGASAVLIVNPAFQFKEARIPSAPPNYTLPEPKRGMAAGLWDFPIFMITPDTANFLLSAAQKTVQDLQAQIDGSFKPSSFDLPSVTVRLEKNFKAHELIRGLNVIGIMEGSDPELKKQYVVVSGHYDHMGRVSGRLYAGADDNASGVVATIETAQAFVRAGIKPKRSVVFACWDAEEEGLYGSYYYTVHPTVPLADTVANINMDMIGRDEESLTWENTAEQNRNMVNIVGTLYNPDIRRIIEQENKPIGLKLDFKTDTRDPEQWFARSDHFWFATRGIPQVLFNTGSQPDYHTENDTWNRINYPKMTKIIQLIFLSTAQVANEAKQPKFTR